MIEIAKGVIIQNCRLSRDDEQDGLSGSIKNQQSILEKYATENGFKNTKVFIDDGWSGPL